MRALLLLIALPLCASAQPRGYSYCDDYLSFLNNHVHYMRMGMPVSPDTFKNPDDEWAHDLRFINSKRPGFDFRDWIDQKYLKCWEETPYGTPSEPRKRPTSPDS